jgi:hypothetical protein
MRAAQAQRTEDEDWDEEAETPATRGATRSIDRVDIRHLMTKPGIYSLAGVITGTPEFVKDVLASHTATLVNMPEVKALPNEVAKPAEKTFTCSPSQGEGRVRLNFSVGGDTAAIIKFLTDLVNSNLI